MIMAREFIIIILLFCFCQTGKALECYVCSVSEQDTDTACIDDPEHGANKIDCNKKYCTSIRQEYKNPPGKIGSMYRGCENSPLYINETIEDATYIFYYIACQEPLCNGGTGKLANGNI